MSSLLKKHLQAQVIAVAIDVCPQRLVQAFLFFNRLLRRLAPPARAELVHRSRKHFINRHQLYTVRSNETAEKENTFCNIVMNNRRLRCADGRVFRAVDLFETEAPMREVAARFVRWAFNTTALGKLAGMAKVAVFPAISSSKYPAISAVLGDSAL